MSSFPPIFLSAATILLIVLCVGGSVCFYVSAVSKKKGELWDQRMRNLSSKKTSEEGFLDQLSLGLEKKANIFAYRVAPIGGRFLRSPTIQKEGSAKSALYRVFLTRLGLDPNKWRHYYFTGKLVAACISVSICILLDQVQFLSSFAAFEQMGLFACIVITGSFVPEITVKKIVGKYQYRIEQVAPDVVDFLLLSIEAGMTFDVALMETKKSLSLYAKGVTYELEQLSAELMILPDRTDAFDNLVRRTGSDTFRYLSTALSQGEKYGTPIVASLRIVAQESRRKTLVDLERRAGKLPVLLSIPLMLLILPPVIVVSAGPGFVTLMRSFGGN